MAGAQPEQRGRLVQVRRQRVFAGGDERHRFGGGQAAEAAPDGKGESNPIVTLPNLLRIKDLLNGSDANDYQTVQVYECDSSDADGCLNPVAKGVALVGLKQRVHDILAGIGANNGLIYKFSFQLVLPFY